MSTIVHSTCDNWRKCVTSGNASASSFSTLTVETDSDSAAWALLLATKGFQLGAGQLKTNTDGTKIVAPGAPSVVENIVVVKPGADADGNTGSLRIWGWNRYATATANKWTMIPQLLIQIAFTSGNIASTIFGSIYMADTITRTAGDNTERLYSPATDSVNDVPAQVAVDILGSEFIFFDFAVNSGSGAAFNGLYKFAS